MTSGELDADRDGIVRDGTVRDGTSTGARARPEPAVLGGFAALGVVAGAAAKAADASTLTWFADLGTYPAVWGLVLALVARFAPSPPRAAFRAAAFFLAMCLAYYGWSLVVLGFASRRHLLAWSLLAVTFVPAGAAVLRWAYASRSPGAGVPVAAAAGIALADGTIRQLWLSATGVLPPGFPLRPVQAAASLVAACVIAGALPIDRRTRVVALLAAVPLAWLVAALLPRLGVPL